MALKGGGDSGGLPTSTDDLIDRAAAVIVADRRSFHIGIAALHSMQSVATIKSIGFRGFHLVYFCDAKKTTALKQPVCFVDVIVGTFGGHDDDTDEQREYEGLVSNRHHADQ